MTDLKIAVRKQPAQYEPGEEIAGAAQWLLTRPPDSVEARLLWYTGGGGSYVAVVVATARFDGALQDDTRPFLFTAPAFPHSYRGTLFTVHWAVELMAYPNQESIRAELVIAPDGKAIEFPPIEG